MHAEPPTLKHHAERMQRAIRRRSWREGLAALFVVGVFTFQAGASDSWFAALGPLLIVAGTLFAVGTLLRASWLAPRVDLSTGTPELAAQCKAALEYQAELLRGVPRWYLAPLVPGLVWSLAYDGWSRGGAAWIVVAVIGLAIFGLFAGIAWLNLRAASSCQEQADRF